MHPEFIANTNEDSNGQLVVPEVCFKILLTDFYLPTNAPTVRFLWSIVIFDHYFYHECSRKYHFSSKLITPVSFDIVS